MTKITVTRFLQFFLLIYQFETAAQINIDTALVSRYDSINQTYVFKPNINININDLVTNHKSNFRLANANTLLNTENRLENLFNGKFYRFKQLYNGVPVEKSMLNVSYDYAQHPINANGNIYQNINLNVLPTVSNNSAINTAIASFPCSRYYWQDSTMEAEIKTLQQNVLATNYPTAQLVILPIANNYYLSYKVRISSIDPINTANVFIDANSGSLLQIDTINSNCTHHKPSDYTNFVPEKIIESVNTSCAGGCQQNLATLHKYATQSINTDEISFGNGCRFILKDNCNGTTLYTRRFGPTNAITQDIRNNSTFWGNGGIDRDGTTCHWSLKIAHEYYKNFYQRVSWDNNGQQVNVFINFNNTGVTGAIFTGSEIVVSKEYGYQHPYVFLDHIGHEYTHGVISKTSLLGNTGENGTLNEGFADVFGTMIEFYGNTYNTNQTGNYIFGDLATANGSGDRSLINPNSKSQPNTYLGNFWATSANFNNDKIIHINSGVLGYWFYLLAEGGSGTNDNNNSYCVSGIGRQKASDIAWLTMSSKLTSSSDYSNCRALSILATEQLYGINSNEVAQVTAAWHAVGVGANYAGQINTQNVTINNSQYDIHYNAKVSLQNVTVNNGPLYVTSNTEIELLPNININNGSIADLYIAPSPCVGGARFGNFGNQNNTSNQNSTNPEIKVTSPISFLIIPNPSNGTFKVATDNSIEYPKQIIVRDVMGRNVKVIDNPISFETEINIETQNAGVYMISVYYSDKVLSKRIIKN